MFLHYLNESHLSFDLNKNNKMVPPSAPPNTPNSGHLNTAENGLLIPFFQPIICCSEGRLIGFEVLARFENSKEKKSYLPSHLINDQASLATLDGVTEELLKKTLKIISKQAHQTLEGHFININLSSKQLGNKKTFDIFSHYATEFLFYGFRLNIEITEGREILDYDKANEFIVDLSKFGVDFYLDDYGKGFSSPILLKYLFVYGIKIDKEFAHNIENCSFSREFILHTVNQARNKGVKVIAEGIETVTQHRLISDLGVDFTQGYLYGKPHPTMV